jgi:ATP-dependent helicase/nuclease subunit A
VLDESATTELLDRLTLDVMLQAANDSEGPLGQALATAITSAADITFKEVVAETIRKRDVVIEWKKRAGGVSQAIDDLTRAFSLTPGDTVQAVEKEYFSDSPITEPEWQALIEVLATSGKTSDREMIDQLTLARTATGRERVDAYRLVFCRADLQPRKNLLTKDLAKAHPQWLERLIAEQRRICDLIVREHALRARDRSAALLTIADAVIDRYSEEKNRRSLLDYDDLIDKTLALFRKTHAAWVLYKLDLGIDHVLVDEAQDTSPKQWEIIKTIVSEFAPGGARENVRRTLFAVGDEKQSIFSFQGAAPLAFADMRRHFGELFAQAGARFENEKLPYSFRSSPIILSSVDIVFSREVAYRGLTHDQTKTVHSAVYDDAPGEVEIWDIVGPDPKDTGKEGWDAPFDTATESSPAIKLAGKIGRAVKRWCASGVRPRDVLILVRQRGPAFEAVIRALKREGIPVAGADRLLLTEHIAVMDLLVLGDALLLPDDDLSLATVLKSPLFGFSEEQLFALAYDRKGPLRAVLRNKANDDPIFAAANRALDELVQAARDMSPFAFYAHVLGPLKGRKRILARLGVEADDPLNEFLNLALDYEQRETPSLQGFLHWVRVAQSEVKRDMEMDRDEVRVMTVHGAKGLEAENVILIDSTTTRPEGAYPPRLLTMPLAHAAPGATALVWAARRDLDVGPMINARTEALGAARDEYRRLLYVGMTRAAKRLVVCATKGVNKIPEDCWYELVCGAIKPEATEETDADGDKVWRMRKGEPSATASKQRDLPRGTSLPEWLERPAAPYAARARRILPSDSGDDEYRREPASGDRSKALRRGTLIHRLLQSMPDIAPERRQRAAQSFLGERKDLSADERTELSEQVLKVLDNSRFAPLFAPGSRAEVSVAGELSINGQPIAVAGQLDRLAVTDSDVLIADYKTNRPPPARIADVPASYLRQLALYRALLQKIYPQKAIRAVLIWTEKPDLMELSADVLDHALAQVTSA